MVLLVVDTQKGIVDERLYAFETFVSNIKERSGLPANRESRSSMSSMTMGPVQAFPSGTMNLRPIPNLHRCRLKDGSSKPYAVRSKKKAGCWNI